MYLFRFSLIFDQESIISTSRMYSNLDFENYELLTDIFTRDYPLLLYDLFLFFHHLKSFQKDQELRYRDCKVFILAAIQRTSKSAQGYKNATIATPTEVMEARKGRVSIGNKNIRDTESRTTLMDMFLIVLTDIHVSFFASPFNN